MVAALEFLLKLANQMPSLSDVHVACKPYNETCRSHYHRMNCFGHKKRNLHFSKHCEKNSFKYTLLSVFAITVAYFFHRSQAIDLCFDLMPLSNFFLSNFSSIFSILSLILKTNTNMTAKKPYNF